MQISKEYQNNFFPHGVVDIEQIASVSGNPALPSYIQYPY
jgi:hypothetical protein